MFPVRTNTSKATIPTLTPVDQTRTPNTQNGQIQQPLYRCITLGSNAEVIFPLNGLSTGFLSSYLALAPSHTLAANQNAPLLRRNTVVLTHGSCDLSLKRHSFSDWRRTMAQRHWGIPGKSAHPLIIPCHSFLPMSFIVPDLHHHLSPVQHLSLPVFRSIGSKRWRCQECTCQARPDSSINLETDLCGLLCDQVRTHHPHLTSGWQAI